MQKALLQLARLRRHCDIAMRTYDHVAFLDLSNTLRIWTEMRQSLEEHEPVFATTQIFRTAVVTKAVVAAARGQPFIFAYMPGGAITYASKSEIISAPDEIPVGMMSAMCMRRADGGMELANYCLASTQLEESLTREFLLGRESRCAYGPWLDSECVRLACLSGAGTLEEIRVPRRILIKRLANTLDGSHHSVVEGGAKTNMYDAPVHHLLRYKLGALPLPYFILLKIAQDILAAAPALSGFSSASHAI